MTDKKLSRAVLEKQLRETALIRSIELSEALLKSEQLVKLPSQDKDVLENTLIFADSFLDFMHYGKQRPKVIK